MWKKFYNYSLIRLIAKPIRYQYKIWSEGSTNKTKEQNENSDTTSLLPNQDKYKKTMKHIIIVTKIVKERTKLNGFKDTSFYGLIRWIAKPFHYQYKIWSEGSKNKTK